MFEEYALVGILEVFLENPHTEYYLREIAEKTGRSTSTVKSATDRLVKQKLIFRGERANLVLFRANTENITFRYMKMARSLKRIQDSGLLEQLRWEYKPHSITLYGGTARGEDDQKSDIDLLLISGRKAKADLSKFEVKLGCEISVIAYTPSEWGRKSKEDKAFYERILIDGITIYGEKPIV